MQKKIIIAIIIIVLIIGNLLQFAHNYCRLPRNAVPDAETAIKIAQATFSKFLEPIHLQSGEHLYWGFKTDFNRLRGAWIVSTYLDFPEGVLINYRASEITISMRDGRVMKFRGR